MKRFTSNLFCVLGVLFCLPLHSQNTDSTKKWNLEDCFQYAEVHNIDINTLKLNESTAKQNLIAAKGVKIPNLSASANNIFDNSKNNVLGNGSNTNQLSSSGTYLVNSSIVLWNGNFINNTIKQNEEIIKAANLSVEQSTNAITLQITQSYLTILLSKENLKYVTDLVTTTEAMVKQSQQLYNAGSIAKTNLLQLQAQLSSDNYLKIQSENSIRQNILSLKQLLQLPSETAFDIVTPTSLEIINLIPELKNVQQNAVDNFPDVKIGLLGLDIASLSIEKAKAGFKPTLAANAAIGSGYQDIISNNTVPSAAYFNQTSNNFHQSLGFTLAIPIFSNRINQTNLEKAKIGYSQATMTLNNDKLILSQEVEQAYLNAANAQQAYMAANEQLSAVTEIYRIGNEQFKLGGIDSYTLLQQRNQYIQAVQAFTQAKYSSILQQKIYEFYNGNKITF